MAQTSKRFKPTMRAALLLIGSTHAPSASLSATRTIFRGKTRQNGKRIQSLIVRGAYVYGIYAGMSRIIFMWVYVLGSKVHRRLLGII